MTLRPFAHPSAFSTFRTHARTLWQTGGQRLDARLEPLGARVRLGDLPCRCGKLLVRHGQRDMIGNPPRLGQVLAGECARMLRPEAESKSLIPGTSQHDQARTKAGSKEAFAQVVRLDDEKIGRREVVDQQKGPLPARCRPLA
jgi:hypothetical protein